MLLLFSFLDLHHLSFDKWKRCLYDVFNAARQRARQRARKGIAIMAGQGKAELNIRYPEADLFRFLDKVEDWSDDSACWIWTGARHSAERGYGKFKLEGKCMNAHKASYILFRGEVAEGKVIAHQCDNEFCVNPLHLEAQSQSENMRHCVEAGRHVSCKGKE